MEVFRKAQISVVIWANHLIRSAVHAMQKTAARILETKALTEVEDHIASVDELFRLQGAEELASAEQRYFSGFRSETSAVILAASRGAALGGLTDERPKVMIPVGGKPLLRHIVDKCKKRGIDDLTVVAGYKAASIDVGGIKVHVNEDHANTGELASLACATARFTDDMLIMYGDLLFRSYILRDLMEHDAPVSVVVDSVANKRSEVGTADLAICSEPDDRSTWGQAVSLKRIINSSDNIDAADVHGRWIGMLRVNAQGRGCLEAAIQSLRQRDDFSRLSIPDLLNFMIDAGHDIRVWYIHGHWLDVNSLGESRSGRRLYCGARLLNARVDQR